MNRSEQSRQNDPIAIPFPRLILAGLAMLALAIGFAVAGADESALAYGLTTESPPASPIDTPTPTPPEPPVIREISPARGSAGRPRPLNVHGKRFERGSQVFLLANAEEVSLDAEEVPEDGVVLPTIFIDARQLAARVPGNVAVGTYHVGVWVDNDTPIAWLPNAYRVISNDPAEVDDLSSRSEMLWTAPHSLVNERETTVGLKIHRAGGVADLDRFVVDFYVDRIDAEHKIGRSEILEMGPESVVSTEGIAWTPTEHGRVTLIAVIDADEEVAEADEENNIIRRSMVVRFRQPDGTPPVAQHLDVNDGAASVEDPNVQLTVEAEDPGRISSGVSHVHYIELHWMPGVQDGAGQWVPVKHSDWLPYPDQPHDFELHPQPGLRYLAAWVADGARNISARPAIRRLSYVDPTDSVLAGEIRVYREDVLADRCLHVRVAPVEAHMDADLYIWAPSGNLAGFSIEGAGEVDELHVETVEAGTYQIEVEGYTEAEYEIAIETLDACPAGRGVAAASISAKSARSQPAIPVSDIPADDVTTPEAISEYQIFLAQMRAPSSLFAVQNDRLYLPLLNR